MGLTWYGEGADFLRLKGMAEVLLSELGLLTDAVFEKSGHPSFHPGRCARIMLEGKDVGTLGELHPECVEQNDLSGRAYAWEMDLTAIFGSAKTERTYAPLPKYPAVERDLAIVLDKQIPAAKVKEIISREREAASASHPPNCSTCTRGPRCPRETGASRIPLYTGRRTGP